MKKEFLRLIKVYIFRFGGAGGPVENVEDKYQDRGSDNMYYQHLSDIQEQVF